MCPLQFPHNRPVLLLLRPQALPLQLRHRLTRKWLSDESLKIWGVDFAFTSATDMSSLPSPSPQRTPPAGSSGTTASSSLRTSRIDSKGAVQIERHPASCSSSLYLFGTPPRLSSGHSGFCMALSSSTPRSLPRGQDVGSPPWTTVPGASPICARLAVSSSSSCLRSFGGMIVPFLFASTRLAAVPSLSSSSMSVLSPK